MYISETANCAHHSKSFTFKQEVVSILASELSLSLVSVMVL